MAAYLCRSNVRHRITQLSQNGYTGKRGRGESALAFVHSWRIVSLCACSHLGRAHYASTAELTIFLGRSPYVPPRDLRAALPCSDALWAAENPQEWAAKLAQDDIRGSCSSACQIVEFRNSGYADLIKAARKSAFASTIL